MKDIYTADTSKSIRQYDSQRGKLHDSLLPYSLNTKD